MPLLEVRTNSTVNEADIREALYDACVACAEREEDGKVQHRQGGVTIKPPDPLPRADGSLPLTVVAN